MKHLTLLFLLAFQSLGNALEFPFLSEVSKATFQKQEEKTLLGESKEANRRGKLEDIAQDDQLGNVAIAARWEKKGIWTDGVYNHREFPVETGKIIFNDRDQSLVAWKISPPLKKATKFLATRHMPCYRFPKRQDYQLLELVDGRLRPFLKIGRTRIKTKRFIPIPEIDASALSGERIFAIVPSTGGISALPHLTGKISGGILLKQDNLTLSLLEYPQTGTPFDTATGFPHGPASHKNQYSYTRQFFTFHHPAGGIGIVWQEPEKRTIHLNWLGKNFLQPFETALPSRANERLLAACMGLQGEIYYLCGTTGKRSEFKDRSTKSGTLRKVSRAGKLLKEQSLNTHKNGLNVTHFGTYPHSLAISGHQLALILSRQMHQSGDGLYHQGAISAVFDTHSLKLTKNHGQTSGHSFDNVLHVDRRGNFLALDLGDNFPRGLHLHRFNASKRHSQVVSTFKTAHSKKDKKGRISKYPELSKPGAPRYKWSNDNSCYTELGGVLETDHGFVVIFAGERSPEGPVLDNRHATSRHSDPRNLALVVVDKNFHTIPRVEGRLIPPGTILSKGLDEEGGFYNFKGDWSPQNHSGIVWLTDYEDKNQQNASRIKTTQLADGSMIILWEEWTGHAYRNTWVLRIACDGQVRDSAVNLGKSLRLGRREDPIAVGNKIFLVSGRKSNSALLLHCLDFH